MAVRQEVNNLESSVVVQELETRVGDDTESLILPDVS